MPSQDTKDAMFKIEEPVILTNVLPLLLMLALILGAVRVIHVFRARAMRSLATRLGSRYIGPPAPGWWNPRHPKLSPPLPVWFSLACLPSGTRQIWNVIEGQENGIAVLIFDGLIGAKGGAPLTFIACQTEQNPFGIATSPDRLIQSHGWTVLYGVWLLWFSWTMGIQRLENNVKKLRVGSATRPL
jgi:hypothetical protein